MMYDVQLRISRSYVNQVCQNLLAIFVQKCIGGRGSIHTHTHTPNRIAQQSVVVLFGPEFEDRDEKYEQGMYMYDMYVYVYVYVYVCMCMCLCYVL